MRLAGRATKPPVGRVMDTVTREDSPRNGFRRVLTLRLRIAHVFGVASSVRRPTVAWRGVATPWAGPVTLIVPERFWVLRGARMSCPAGGNWGAALCGGWCCGVWARRQRFPWWSAAVRRPLIRRTVARAQSRPCRGPRALLPRSIRHQHRRDRRFRRLAALVPLRRCSRVS